MILDRLIEVITNFDVASYARTRNFKNGTVSRLSPYISRGVISTKFVLELLMKKGLDKKKMENFFKNWYGEIIGKKYGKESKTCKLT